MFIPSRGYYAYVTVLWLATLLVAGAAIYGAFLIHTGLGLGAIAYAGHLALCELSCQLHGKLQREYDEWTSQQ